MLSFILPINLTTEVGKQGDNIYAKIIFVTISNILLVEIDLSPENLLETTHKFIYSVHFFASHEGPSTKGTTRMPQGKNFACCILCLVTQGCYTHLLYAKMQYFHILSVICIKYTKAKMSVSMVLNL